MKPKARHLVRNHLRISTQADDVGRSPNWVWKEVTPDFKRHPRPGTTPATLVVEEDEQRRGFWNWNQVIEMERDVARNLVASAWKEFPPWMQWVAENGLARCFGEVYNLAGGLYQRDLKTWAAAVGRDFGTLAMINCAYELEHLNEYSGFLKGLARAVFGCSAGFVELRDGSMVHLRNLDWPIAGMGTSTRVFEFRSGTRCFYSVGFPGAIGVLSGMVPGAYSVTINWAPPQQVPSFEHAPSLLLRKVLETCDTYESALERLTHTPLCTSVFYALCGVTSGQACVIERTPNDHFVRPVANGFLGQTNHHQDTGWLGWCNQRLELLADDPLVKTTHSRRADFERALSERVGLPWSEENFFEAFDAGEYVTNPETCQRMIFRPAQGEIYLESSL